MLLMNNINKVFCIDLVEIIVLCDFNFIIDEGDFVFVIGLFGLGKMMFLNIVGLLEIYISG